MKAILDIAIKKVFERYYTPKTIANIDGKKRDISRLITIGKMAKDVAVIVGIFC